MDEIFEAILKEAMKNMGGTTPPNRANAPKPDYTELMKAAAKKTAESTKGLYDAYIAAGFTEVQAFELVKANITKKG